MILLIYLYKKAVALFQRVFKNQIKKVTPNGQDGQKKDETLLEGEASEIDGKDEGTNLGIKQSFNLMSKAGGKVMNIIDLDNGSMNS